MFKADWNFFEENDSKVDSKNFISRFSHLAILSQNQLEEQILQFVKNRYFQKNESSSIRFIHIRFEIEESIIEEILEKYVKSNQIMKYYDKDFEERRYKPKSD